jgi:hypothetical protein
VSLINFCQAYLAAAQKPRDRVDEMCLATILYDLETNSKGIANSTDPIESFYVSKESFYKMHLFYGNAPQNLTKVCS